MMIDWSDPINRIIDYWLTTQLEVLSSDSVTYTWRDIMSINGMYYDGPGTYVPDELFTFIMLSYNNE